MLVTGAVVERVHSDRFNIESSDPRAGLAVMGGGAIPGTAVTVLGSMGLTADDERVLNLTQILSAAESRPPATVFMTTRALGGYGTVGMQTGIPGSTGANNIGLDVAIAGQITAIAGDNSWMTVDDGAGRASGHGSAGVAVVGSINASARYVGQFVIVRGSSSIIRLSGIDYSLIRVANSTDISP